MPSRTWIALLSLAGFVLACEPQAEETAETAELAVDVAAEEQAIRDLADQYTQAFDAGNVEGVLALYTADAMEIAADGTAEPASNSVPATMSQAPDATIGIDHERIVIAESGDVGYDTGTVTITATGPDGQPVPQTSRYLVTFKKVDGAWKLDVTMSSAPIAGAPGDTTAATADTTGP